ncbi:MAG TPA: hypothetical protein VMR18_04285 [Candidatus Saccharimonadales bacterium]|nr:hypothetical protein [Candidatus Saccharimonadales bacterium]
MTSVEAQKQLDKLEKDSGLVLASIRLLEGRAGTMSAVTATILGIGLPLLAQPGTKKYLHFVPLLFLFMSFLFFYAAFIKSPMVKFGFSYKNETGAKKKFGKPPIERLIMYQSWKTWALQLGHASFLTAIMMEIIAISDVRFFHRGKILQFILGICSIVILQKVIFYHKKGEI